MRVHLLLAVSASVLCAQQSFTPTVIAAAGAPSGVLYGTYKGTFLRSADAGATWAPVYLTEPGSPQPSMQGIVIDPANSKTVYVATTVDAGGVWRSTDDGVTWTKGNAGLPPAGGPVRDLKLLANVPPALFARVGNQVFQSADQGSSWTATGPLPAPNGGLAFSDAPFNTMYFVDSDSLSVYKSVDFGHAWALTGSLPAQPAPGQTSINVSVLNNPSEKIFVSLKSVGFGSAPYLSTGGGGVFTDQSGAGLGLFTKMDAAPGQTVYAFGDGGPGFYKSDDFGVSWRAIGVSGAALFTLGAVDPSNRMLIYAVRGGSFPGLVKSTDSGVNWTAIQATITPTLAKPAPMIAATVQETAPYSQSFIVQALEDGTWPLSVTLTTSGEPWLKLAATTGTTPLANSITINSTGMQPGSYQASIRISAPQSFNQAVTVPVQLTILAAGSTGPQYTVSTFGGNGDPTSFSTTGSATTVAIGAAKALVFDNSGRLLVSGGNRIWQISNGVIAPIAGSGALASSGDGGDALQASIADPDALLLDPQGTLYFTEYSTGRIRKLLNGAINTFLDLSKLNIPATHAILFDSFGRLLLANSTGLLRYDGTRVQTVTAYPMSDPYSMIADPAGNIYISDRGAHQILKFPVSGPVTIVAGLGAAGFGGDGGPATQASLSSPSGLALDGQGTIYIADSGNQRIRSITSDGVMHTVAGSGVRGFAGDGSTADFASFQNPAAVALDGKGALLVADSGNNRIRRLAFAAVPSAKPTAVVHAASGSLQIAPGGLFSVYGDLLSLITAQSSTATWPKTLGGVSVTINGIAAPLYYASKTLINGQVPYEVAPGPATVIVTVNGAQPAQVAAQVIAANPGLLLYNGRALAVNVDGGTVNGPDAPAAANSFVILYLSGIGIPDHPVATGAPAPSVEPFARVAYPSSITVGNLPVSVPFFGLAPGYPALAQANIMVPDLPKGDYPVVVTVNGVQSNSATISIRN